MKKLSINWRIFFTLLVLNILSVFAVLPYVLTIQGDFIRQANIPVETLIVAQTIIEFLTA